MSEKEAAGNAMPNLGDIWFGAFDRGDGGIDQGNLDGGILANNNPVDNHGENPPFVHQIPVDPSEDIYQMNNKVAIHAVRDSGESYPPNQQLLAYQPPPHSDNNSANIANTWHEGKQNGEKSSRKSSICSSVSGSQTSDSFQTYGKGTSTGNKPNRRKRKPLTDELRLERNEKEKQRCQQLNKQYAELQDLLSGAGIVIPKGTKGCVLHATMSYIQMLQEQHAKMEQDNRLLLKQIESVQQSARGQPGAEALQQIALRNGIQTTMEARSNHGEPQSSGSSSHGNFLQMGQVTPKNQESSSISPLTTLTEADYPEVFDQTPVGMALATLGGAFLDCNKFFCKMSNYSKKDFRSLTIFNFIARDQLQQAYERISQLLQYAFVTPDGARQGHQNQQSVTLRSELQGFDLQITSSGTADKAILYVVLVPQQSSSTPTSLLPATSVSVADTSAFSLLRFSEKDKDAEMQAFDDGLPFFAVG